MSANQRECSSDIRLGQLDIGKTQNHVGFYFYTEARIRKVRVYVKGPPDDLDLD